MRGRDADREYRRTHPWIRFRLDPHEAPGRVWFLLGQAVARAELLGGALIPSRESEALHRTFLVKGARATAAIEGNTLTEAEVGARLAGKRDLPRSRAYLGVEVDNVLRACNGVTEELLAGGHLPLHRTRIEAWNETILRGLEDHVAEEAVLGVIRSHSVVVGRYRGAPAEDCVHLLDRLALWLEQGLHAPATPDRDDRMATGILRGILAHLWLAWIHPFGDGNGRVARLAELFFLLRAGLPTPACHLPSNHYYRTRDEYYRQLDRSSRARGGRGDPWGFVVYALDGLVDGLKEQASLVERGQRRLAWPGFVRERIGGRPNVVRERRNNLALVLGAAESPLSRVALQNHPRLARSYARRTGKTLTRDLNWLVARGVAKRTPHGFRARMERLQALRPQRAREDASP